MSTSSAQVEQVKEKEEPECPACDYWQVFAWFFGVIVAFSGFIAFVMESITAYTYVYAVRWDIPITNTEGEQLFDLIAAILWIPTALLLVVGFPAFRAIVDGKVHVHCRVQQALRVGGTLQIFDLGKGPIIQKPLGGWLRKVRVINVVSGVAQGSMFWDIIRTGILPQSFILRDCNKQLVGEDWRDGNKEWAFFWLRQESVQILIDKFSIIRGNAVAFEQEATRLRAETEIERERATRALACIEDLRVAMQVLKQRIEESGTGKPRHRCDIAVPIKACLDRISLAIPRVLCGTPLWDSGKTKIQMAEWLARLPKLLEPKQSSATPTPS